MTDEDDDRFLKMIMMPMMKYAEYEECHQYNAYDDGAADDYADGLVMQMVMLSSCPLSVS